MENEENLKCKEDIPQSGRNMNTTYAVMLCVYFCYLFRISISGVSQICNSIIPDILQSDSPAFFSLFYLDWVFWILFGFWTIILALKGSQSAIPCLKLSLPFHFVSLLFNGMTRVSDINFGIQWLSILFLFFPLIFFIYLCASKKIKADYPKEERRLGVPGIVGVFLYILLGLLLTQMIVSSVNKSINSKKVDSGRIELYDNELTDGRAIFKPKDTWRLDSVITPLSIEDTFCFYDSLSHAKIRVSCTKEEYEPSRHYYIYSIIENLPLDGKCYKDEIEHRQFETEDAIFFFDQYEFQMDSTLYYWTYASRLGKKVEKGVRLSIIDKDSLKTSIEDAIEFLDNTTFNVRSRLLKKDRVN